MTKLVAIMGGGDWADASVEHLEIPDDMDLEREGEVWRVERSKLKDKNIGNLGGRYSVIDFLVKYVRP